MKRITENTGSKSQPISTVQKKMYTQHIENKSKVIQFSMRAVLKTRSLSKLNYINFFMKIDPVQGSAQ